MAIATALIPTASPAATSARYLRLVRASAVYDLVTALAFATPWTFALTHGALDALSSSLGLRGFPEPDLMQVLYAGRNGRRLPPGCFGGRRPDFLVV